MLAAAGSAVGLGNLWKFPYITWHNNGGAFVLVYLVCILVVGMPIMMAEIMIGRKTQESAVPAFRMLGGKGWSLVGLLGTFTGFVILGYYTVIAGWTIHSFFSCLDWSINGYTAPGDGAFGEFLSNAPLQLGLAAIFSLFTIGIVWLGVGGGIERFARILMPVLFIIMIVLVITVFTMPGIGETFRFLFRPNFKVLPAAGVLEALGHAFFTLSLGMGAMIAYGSYLRPGDSVPKVSGMVVLLDTLIALLACVIMYTIIFSTPGLEDDIGASTVGMLFITLPKLFYTEMTLGSVVGPLFYVLVGFAALTSTISLLEVMTAYFIDTHGWKRHKAVITSGVATFVSTILCALSLGAVGGLSNFVIFEGKPGFLSTLDHLASNWLLPVGGLLTTIFAGWFIKKKMALEELNLYDEVGNPTIYFKVWRVFIRFLAPAAILAVIIAVIQGVDFS